MPDEKLVGLIGDALESYYTALGWPVAMTASTRPYGAAEAVIAALAERGRLIPDGAEVDQEWGMRYKLNGRPQTPEDTGHTFDSRHDAQQHITVWAKSYPTLTYTDVEYLVRQRITTPWVVADSGETTDG